MFKLKLINKPKMMKLKCNFTFPNIVLANLQEKEATPTKEIQQIIADQQYDGLSKVVVNAIPDEYIIPNGDINIIENGTYDVTDKINAIVNIPEKKLGTKTITSNGTYKAADDNLDGYSEVEVATSGVDINEYFKPTIQGGDMYGNSGWSKTFLKFRSPLIVEGTNAKRLFYQYPLKELPDLLETDKITNMENMFGSCKLIKTIPNINTSNVTNMSEMFYGCFELETLQKLNCSNVERINGVVNNCNKLQNIGGFENLGQAYKTTTGANNYYYTLTLSNNELTHDSLMNVINNLYDIKTKGCNPQSLVLGSTNISKLSAEEIQIATDKGFNVN